MSEPFRPQNVVENLRELAALTSTEGGAQRVAWTDTWLEARRYLRSHLERLPVEVDEDEAGNLWARLEGDRPETLVVGSHIDSVPDGGWLDGAFGIMTGLEALRATAEGGRPPCSVALVDWADEEGARFGRSLFGSSAASGTLDVEAVRNLLDRNGDRLEDVLRAHGVVLDRIHEATSRLEGVAAYLEAHIEQGPVLESEGLGAGVVLGTLGIERHRIIFHGEAAHAGSTPMDRRRDPLLAAAATALEVRDAAITYGGVGTVGEVRIQPGVVTAIGESVEVLLDQRHLDADGLVKMNAAVRRASESAAAAEGCEVEWHTLWQIEPMPFHEKLIEPIRRSCERVYGRAVALPSGALHDAAEMARHVPTAMVFASSRRGLSHNRGEDTPVEDLLAASEVFAEAVEAAIDLIGAGEL